MSLGDACSQCERTAEFDDVVSGLLVVLALMMVVDWRIGRSNPGGSVLGSGFPF